MPVNALRKTGARMSLQEALERMEKLKRLMQSSNEHEAALAALRLKTFDVNAARAPRLEKEPIPTPVQMAEDPTTNQSIPVLDDFPDVPYETLDELEAHQPEDKTSVNWAELHKILLQQALAIGADAVTKIQLKGTPKQKILGGTAIRYLTAQDLFEIDQAHAIENIEEHIKMEAKERRDEDTAPGYG
ncbi:hypothetical protein [Candidatus Nitronereus thalassa]|uniref:Uncharacterized protein n=1 Tax=Candidatus Nitronereus thalassa TaxID=3020898 RepID=A0ABU3KA14_9BACT|nr:hypothetical protein [Candidatus Nitronereus thalassa]MDT7043219.1 hypothetical protein [Candidatus Nitronereus thalassa]